MKDFFRITGLWKHESKRGEQYLQGKLPGLPFYLVIFKNKFKNKDGDPDYTVNLKLVDTEKGKELSDISDE